MEANVQWLPTDFMNSRLGDIFRLLDFKSISFLLFQNFTFRDNDLTPWLHTKNIFSELIRSFKLWWLGSGHNVYYLFGVSWQMISKRN